eukprot:scaffold5263_cov146-Isochrysis_galbana.AAC.2
MPSSSTSAGCSVNGSKHSTTSARPSAVEMHSSNGSECADGAMSERRVPAVPAVARVGRLSKGLRHVAELVPGRVRLASTTRADIDGILGLWVGWVGWGRLRSRSGPSCKVWPGRLRHTDGLP